jgi:fatty acid desaturase
MTAMTPPTGLGPFYNGWLFFLCNSTQHVGMHHAASGAAVEDFRLTTRTFYLNNPVIRVWYWHMNYHIEHHMYAAVPCYNLEAAHNAIKHDLPPTPNGLREAWAVIAGVLEAQKTDTAYVMPVMLPSGTVGGTVDGTVDDNAAKP